MSSKEIKIALKAARTAIQNKEYGEALRNCQYILKKDGSNYNALVFAGLCYSETNENDLARESYKEAIKSHPDQILAYQGFANLYAKHWSGKKSTEESLESIEIYENILIIMERKDIKKYIEICLDLSEAYMEVGSVNKLLKMLEEKLNEFSDLEKDVKTPLYWAVVKSLKVRSEDHGVEVKYSKLFIEAFLALLDVGSSGPDAMNVLKEYLSYLQCGQDLFKQNLLQLLPICAQLHTKFPDEHLPLEVLIQAYVQNCESEAIKNIDPLLEKLEALNGEFFKVGLGFQQLQSQRYENAEKTLSNVMPEFPSFLPGWVILCEAQLQLHKYGTSESTSKTALMHYKQIANGSKAKWLVPITGLDEIRFELTKSLAISLCGSQTSENIQTGVSTFGKLLQLNSKDIFLHINMAKGHMKLKEFDRASETIKQALVIESGHPDLLAWDAYIKSKSGSKEECIYELTSISPPTATSLFLVGKCMWEAGGVYRTEKDNCFTSLVKAAKLDPRNGEIFLLLGHFYARVQRDAIRAKGCYQKSYHLDPSLEEAAACLADVYVAEGDTDSAILLYENITKEAGPGSCKWAWLRLGLCKLKAKDVNNAIQCLQSALRIDPDDAICWECLGEGYLQRGSFTAAWKAFGRANELNPDSVYSLYQMAKVKQIQGLYADAIKEYNDVLELYPNYVPALQGLAESELLLSQNMMHEGRFQTGIEHLEKAILHLTTGCLLRSDLCCFWKLLGDCCIIVHSLDGSRVQMRIPAVLFGSKLEARDELKVTQVGKTEILILSSRCYCRAIGLQMDNACLWHDLGLSYFRQAIDVKLDSKKSELAGKAMSSVKKAIELEPTNHTFWSSLGVLAASKIIDEPALAQHCFITSINHETNNVQAWSNLATLYLFHDHVKKAHEAFKVAQSLEPSFVNSWVGQAIIAETIGSAETMDLYRHSTELGLHKQGTVGYCNWVTRVMADTGNRSLPIFSENITNMNAVAMATTQMSKHSWSSSIYGFLLEHSGLNRSAEEAYRCAYQALIRESEDSKDIDDALTRKDELNKAAANLARMQCKNGCYDDAVATYRQISPLSDFYDVCGLALTFYKSGEFLKALESYKQAGQLSTTDFEKAQVMVAMAMTFWKMNKPDEAKTLLYGCFQSSKSGLQVLCALAIVLKDQTLVGAAVGEILKNLSANKDERDLTDVCLLISAAAQMCGDDKLAVSVVQKALHQYPSSWSIRALLCRLLVFVSDSSGMRATSLISDQAEKLFNKQCLSSPLGRNSELWRGPAHQDEHVSVQQCKAVSTLAAGSAKAKLPLVEDATDRLRQAQIFAHMHPYEPSSWACLSCACHARDVAKSFDGQEIKPSNLVNELAERSVYLLHINWWSKEQMMKWKKQINSWNQILSEVPLQSDMNDDDLEFIHLLQQASVEKDKTKLSNLIKKAETLVPKIQQAVFHKYLGHVLKQLGMLQAAKQHLEKSIDLCTKNQTAKLSAYFFLLNLLLTRYSDSHVEEVQNVITEMAKLDSKSPQSLLFQGLAMRMQKNRRKAKSYFNRILNSTDVTADETRSVAIWYLYRTLHEWNDAVEIEKLVGNALEMNDKRIGKLIELLPVE